MRIQNRTQSTLPCQTSETRSTVVSQFTCQGSYKMEQSLRQKTPQIDVLYQQHSRPSHDKPRGRQPSGLSANAILRRQLRRRPERQQIHLRSSSMFSGTKYFLPSDMALQETRSDFTLSIGIRSYCPGRRTTNGGITSTGSLGIDMRSIHRFLRWLKSFKGYGNATGTTLSSQGRRGNGFAAVSLSN